MLIFVKNIPVCIKETVEGLRNFEKLSFDKIKTSFESVVGNVVISSASDNDILAYITFLQKSKITNVNKIIFLVPSVKDFKESVIRKVQFIKAAGGVVQNTEKEILIMKRLGVWDLPKGKADNGEKWITTAVREVEEECGVLVIAHDKIAVTWHTYFQKGKLVIKKTKWYYMKLTSDKDMKPQKEEGIEELKWVKTDKLEPIYENTYNSIRYVLDKYLGFIAKA